MLQVTLDWTGNTFFKKACTLQGFINLKLKKLSVELQNFVLFRHFKTDFQRMLKVISLLNLI